MKYNPITKLLAYTLVFSTIIFIFSSCAPLFQNNFDSLMRPPSLTIEQKEIHTALQKYTNSSVVLQFPKSGDYRQAFIPADFDNDKSTRYVAFYRPKGEATSIHINLLTKIESEDETSWKSTFDSECSGNRISTVSLENLTGDNRTQLVTTWILDNTKDRGLIIYDMQDNELQEIFNTTYSEMSLTDMNNDGINDIFLINQSFSSEDKPADTRASVFTLKDYKKSLIGSCKMDPSSTSFSSVKSGKLQNNITAIFVDTFKSSNSMSTEIIYFDRNKIINPLFDEETNTIKASLRNTNFYSISTDIDLDGLTEFPSTTELPGYLDKSPGEKYYFTTWNRLELDTVKPLFDCIMNPAYGFYLIVPPEFKSYFTIESLNNNSSMIFKAYPPEEVILNPNANIIFNEIFTITVFSHDDWDSPVNDSYRKLHETDKFIIAVKFTDYAATFKLSYASISANFNLIS